MNFLYLSPAFMIGLQGTGGGGAIATYDDDWITDGLPNRPVRYGGTNPSPSIAGTANNLNFASVHSAQLTPGATITVGALVMTVPAYAGRVPVNPWAALTVGGVLQAGSGTGSATFAIAGNSVNPAILGHAFAGQAKELEYHPDLAATRLYQRYIQHPPPAQLGNVRAYPTDQAGRRYTGRQTLTLAGMEAVFDWFEATNDGYLPSVIVPDPTINDAWTVQFNGEPQYSRTSAAHYDVQLDFIEYPRRRWIN